MDTKQLILKLGFIPKDNAVGIFIKKYPLHDNYCLEVDFGKEFINYGNLILSENKTTQNFYQPENWVVLECVDRLLNKGYKPQNIILEKTWGAGHGTSGRLDICVTREEDGSEYLLIECKTYGKEFDKELARMNKDGGQLFTYFKFSNKADVIMLYASELKHKEIIYKNEIIKIEDDYRFGDVKDFYNKWNRLTKDNGVFDAWVNFYCFESKALTINELEEIKQEDSSFIFNRFLEILRHNVVSDKPNAFNKIFTLFLCKIYDEKINEGTGNELGFQWVEGVDDDISFQLRLTDLYKEGMWEFLEKRVTDFSEDEFEKKYRNLDANLKIDILRDFKKLRLEKNNEFAIKEVYDEKSFKENAKVVKQVVELLQKYKIRYAKKQQYLSDFFELLLTTGLKQESGQFFTPVPIAQFVIKSLPIDSIVEAKLKKGKHDELLPYIIDYAAGSGHFITESMHEIQRLLNKVDLSKVRGEAKRFIETAQISHFGWALHYIYGVEKDYRLVKVGKVGCYLHGDGLANVIHSDGLSNFEHPDYKGKLREIDKDFKQENKQFDVVVSNPPYSVSAFKNAAREYYKDEDFDLYGRLTDNSSEIECLFIERTKQLLKDGGVAGIVLPSSILSNAGIYTKAREIILQYFDIIAITELGSNTFMATGTNTVVLFLRRRNNYESINLRKSVESFFTTLLDVTLNGIENPVSKYVEYAWKGLSYVDYLSIIKNSPYDFIENECELYQEYRKKIKTKTEKEFWDAVLELEKEKLYYFILTYPQKVVLVKSGEKNAEKRFLGYEFSNRRGNEGIHPIQRGKAIDKCTKMFDAELFDNPEKASTYINKAFSGDFDFPIDESMSANISRANLVDMMTFDRVGFEKNISLSVKKVTIQSQWPNISIEEITLPIESGSRPTGGVKNITGGILSLGGEHIDHINGYVNLSSPKYVPLDFFQQVKKGVIGNNDILLCKDGALTGKVALVRDELLNKNAMVNEHIFILRSNDIVMQKYLFYFLHSSFGQRLLKSNITGAAQGGLNLSNLATIKIPHPPKSIQTKIITEIEKIEELEIVKITEIARLNSYIRELIKALPGTIFRIDQILSLEYGKPLPEYERIPGNYPVLGSNGIVGYHNEYLIVGPSVIVGRKGSAGEVVWVEDNSFPIDTTFYVCLLDNSNSLRLIYHILKGLDLIGVGTGVPGLNRNDVYQKSIVLPDSNEQQKIASKIEGLEKQITEAQKVIDSSAELKNAVLKKYL